MEDENLYVSINSIVAMTLLKDSIVKGTIRDVQKFDIFRQDGNPCSCAKNIKREISHIYVNTYNERPSQNCFEYSFRIFMGSTWYVTSKCCSIASYYIKNVPSGYLHNDKADILPKEAIVRYINRLRLRITLWKLLNNDVIYEKLQEKLWKPPNGIMAKKSVCAALALYKMENRMFVIYK